MRKKYLLSCIAIASLTSSIALASPYGVNLSYLIIDKDPSNFHGYRGSVQYSPPSLAWEHWHILFDAGFGHWWVSGGGPYSSINIYSIAPIFRLYLTNAYVSPFVDLSIGPSYMTKTHIADRKLGIHFAFQDQLGIGISVGKEKNFSVSLYALHYSNGSLSQHNSGITVPVLLNMSYRF